MICNGCNQSLTLFWCMCDEDELERLVGEEE